MDCVGSTILSDQEYQQASLCRVAVKGHAQIVMEAQFYLIRVCSKLACAGLRSRGMQRL